MRKALLTLATLLSATIMTQGSLVHYWDFNEGSGVTAGDTGIGTSANGTLSGTVSWAIGSGDRASYLSFDGQVNSHVNPSLTMNLNTDFTWAVWVNSQVAFTDGTSNSQRDAIIMGNRRDGTGAPIADFSPRQFVKISPQRFNWHKVDEGGTSPAEYPNIPVDEWVHLAVVKSGSEVTSYYNGVAADTNTVVALALDMPFFIGGEPDNPGGERFTGGIDDVRIYDNALTAGEVAALIPEPGTFGLVAVFGGSVFFFRRRYMT